MKKVAGFTREKGLEKETYFNDAYFDKKQLLTMSEQIHLVYEYSKIFTNTSILEVGKGNGFVSDFFKKAEVNYKTVDINANLEPDIVGNILELDNLVSFSSDIVFCAEVLEHMEFKHFDASLKQLSNASKKYVIITIPEFKRFFGVHLEIKLPKIKHISFPLYFKTRHNKTLPAEHFWEIDYDNVTSRFKIESIIQKHFKIIEKGFFHTNPYHNFYILQKTFSSTDT